MVSDLERDAQSLSNSEPLLQHRERQHTVADLRTSTVLHSVFNVVNLFTGVGLLSLPYGMRLGGWMSAPALVAATLLYTFSGHLIVEGFRKVGDGEHSYAALGERAFGTFGRRAVLLCTVLDMFGGCAICLIMSCKQIEGLVLPSNGAWGLPASKLARAVGIAAAAPTVMIPSFRQLAPVSLLGISCAVLVAFAILMSAALDGRRSLASALPSGGPPAHHVFSPSIAQAIGIFALSMAGHSALPSFRNSMGDPGRFHLVINSAFAVILAFNAAVAFVGYWYWGDAVSDIVMKDIALKSPFSGVQAIGLIMTALIGLNAFSKVPTVLLVLEDLLISSVFPNPTMHRRRLGLMIKGGIFVGAAALTVVAYDVLGTVMSLLGGLTSMNASVVFPALFYLRLFWRETSAAKCICVGLMLVLSVVVSLDIVVESLKNLVDRGAHQPEHLNAMHATLSAISSWSRLKG